jgi:pyruvate/2-oxoglutarate/acetoin dehydrogenase E1 component
MDQIVNSAALLHHMSGGQFAVPLVLRMATGAGKQLAAQHSHSLENWFAHVPGLKVACPATVSDARHLLGLALEDPNPVLLFEHVMLYNREEVLAEETPDLKSAVVRREGSDVSIVTYGGSLPKASEAAEVLSSEGIDAEVIDLRWLRPLDVDTLVRSVAKTHRVVLVDEGWKAGSMAAEICAQLVERAFFELDAPIRRVCTDEVPIPYPAHLEQAVLPSTAKVVAATREVLGRG